MSQKSIHDRIMFRKQADQISVDDIMEPRRNWAKTATLSLLFVAVAAGIGFAAMNYSAIGEFVSQPASAETNQVDQELADTPFLRHAKQAGLQACSTVFPALGALLTNGTEYSVQSSWNGEAANNHAVQTLVGMDYATESYSGPAAGIVYAVPNGSACEGAMIRVAPFSTSCGEIPAVLPEGSKLTNNLGQVAVYTLGGDSGQALLLPTGNTCVVISVASVAGL